MPLVKICGITNIDDALAAVESGANALGFVFAKSPRQVTPAAAAKIISKLPPFVIKTGVFVNEVPSLAVKIANDCGLNAIQLHGEEIPELLSLFKPFSIIKAFRIKNKNDLGILPAYMQASAFLLDSFVPGKKGGTGKTFDWKLAVEAKKAGKPVILSGGLTPENVKEAVKKTDPYCVDTSSGVESKPGKKDRKKVARFIKNAKEN